MRMRSTNPVLRGVLNNVYVSEKPVTYSNVAYKSIFLIALVFASAFTTIYVAQTVAISTSTAIGVIIGAFILGFVSVIVGTRSVRLSPYFAALYAICEGIVLSVISVMFNIMSEGIVPTALITTIIVFVIMLLLYSTRIIKLSLRFTSIMVVALVAVIIMSLLSFILPFSANLYYIVVVISAVLSAFFLLMDFKSIESCVESGTDSRYGWILSLGLLVTLVWIYIEMLRLLAIISRRR